MKNSHKKAKRSNLLLVAEMVQLGHAHGEWHTIAVNDRNVQCSKWCCNALESLMGTKYSHEAELLRDHFDPGYIVEGGGWWNRNESEPRLLALLLCAEMLRR